jgi:hypothetical protein
MEKEIRELISPHFGHLDFLLKITKDGVGVDDIKELLRFIDNKSLVSSLPKNLHSYNSYFSLIKDLYFINENIILIRFIKDNLSANSKLVLLELIKTAEYNKLLRTIINDDELTKSFLRWSSRVNDIEYAKLYVKSVISNRDILSRLSTEKSNLIELNNYDENVKYLPSSWCINSRGTFDSYIRRYRIFLWSHGNVLYGINCDINTGDIIYIQNQDNQSVGGMYPNTEILNAAREELVKYTFNGNSDGRKVNRVIKKSGKKGIFSKFYYFVSDVMILIKNILLIPHRIGTGEI